MTAKNRRHALGALMALAGTTALHPRMARSQNATAPIGDSTQLADLGMPLSAEQRAAGSAFLRQDERQQIFFDGRGGFLA